jgi:hypothetical protein
MTPTQRHHPAQENRHAQERADRSPHPGPDGDGEKNEEWIDSEPMTDEGRRDDLPLQYCDAEIGERRDDCVTERRKCYEADDEECSRRVNGGARSRRSCRAACSCSLHGFRRIAVGDCRTTATTFPLIWAASTYAWRFRKLANLISSSFGPIPYPAGHVRAFGHLAMSPRCPVRWKADTTGRFYKLDCSPGRTRST